MPIWKEDITSFFQVFGFLAFAMKGSAFSSCAKILSLFFSFFLIILFFTGSGQV